MDTIADAAICRMRQKAILKFTTMLRLKPGVCAPPTVSVPFDDLFHLLMPLFESKQVFVDSLTSNGYSIVRTVATDTTDTTMVWPPGHHIVIPPSRCLISTLESGSLDQRINVNNVVENFDHFTLLTLDIPQTELPHEVCNTLMLRAAFVNPRQTSLFASFITTHHIDHVLLAMKSHGLTVGSIARQLTIDYFGNDRDIDTIVTAVTAVLR
jgi:hypothetical protein